MDRFDRIYRLHGLLINRRTPIPLTDIMDKLQCSKSTVTRCIEELRNYKALILQSQGEADALVLYEAQMAGLPILVTKEGIGAQDISLPWINLIDDASSPTEIEGIVDSIHNTPDEIAAYARANYSWTIKKAALIAEMQRLIQ